MSSESIVVNSAEREWEGWPADQVEERGNIAWKTLLSSEQTPTDSLTFGVAKVPPGGALHAHRHAQPEIYFVLEGEGLATVDGAERELTKGDAIFFPGDVVHSVRSAGADELHLAYAFPADSADDINYVFEE